MTTRHLAVKVCGMRNAENISAIAALAPDYLGLIFVPTSPRCCTLTLDPDMLRTLPTPPQLVGVFRNQPLAEVVRLVRRFGCSVVQLHGDEDHDYLQRLSEQLPQVARWKARSVSAPDDLSLPAWFGAGSVDAVLFDCGEGGSGQRFPWSWLEYYQGQLPFVLAGGIDPTAAAELVGVARRNPALLALDLNSRFECAPGMKDPRLIDDFLQTIRGYL